MTDLISVAANPHICSVLFSVIIAASTIMTMAPHFLTFGRAATAAIELFKLIDRESEIDAFDSSGLQPEAVSGNIEIEGVTFMYPSRPDTVVLDNLTLSVPDGKVTALVVSEHEIRNASMVRICYSLTEIFLGTKWLWEKHYYWPHRALV